MSKRKVTIANLVETIKEISSSLVLLRIKSNEEDLVSEGNSKVIHLGQKRNSEPISPEMNDHKKLRTVSKNVTNAENNDSQRVIRSNKVQALRKERKPMPAVEVLCVSGPRLIRELDLKRQESLQEESCDVAEVCEEAKSLQDTQNLLLNGCSYNGVLQVKEPVQETSSDQSLKENQVKPSEACKCVVDQERACDPLQVSLYAQDIFNYFKSREGCFKCTDYMTWQKNLTSHMRAILVEWLVEIQVNFKLTHETLYLAVKIVDQYLSNVQINKGQLQLVGATALFIACKYEECTQPMMSDFLYICDGAYKRKEIISMERKILSTLGFDIGFPISYQFLRRYAKCARMDTKTLTLARYILEVTLMDYNCTQQKESRLAASALFLAIKMKDRRYNVKWDKSMVYCTGYQEADLIPLVTRLNGLISMPEYKHLITIRSKYSHRIFHGVAKIAPIPTAAVQSMSTGQV